MNKLIFPFIFAVTFVSQNTHAIKFPLTSQSRKHVALMAAAGAGVGALTMLLHYYPNQKDNETPMSDSSKWAKVKRTAKKGMSILTFAAFCGALIGYLAYLTTPEKWLEYAENELTKLNNDEAFKALMAKIAEPNSQTPEIFQGGSPYKIDFMIGYFGRWICNIQNALFKVKRCGITSLVTRAEQNVSQVEGLINFLESSSAVKG